MTAFGSDPAASPAEANGAFDGDAGNVDKIRDILFGSQMRDYERRFALLEERLLRESSNLRDDLGNRLSATEQFLRNELESLGASLRSEERERLAGIRSAMDAISSLNHELSERLANMAEQAAQQQRDLRALMQEQQRQLSEDSQRRHTEVSDALRREAYDLRDAKADRHALAAMFVEFAHRLSGDAAAR